MTNFPPRMSFFLASIAFGLLAAFPAFANTPQESFTEISKCIKMRDAEGCRDKLTASSVELYDRFVTYGIFECLPQDAAYVSQTQIEDYIIVRASTMQNDQLRTMRLAFVMEEDKWKLDVPESLRIGMGENWEKNVAITEQLFLALRQQWGGRLNCSAIQEMANIQAKRGKKPLK